MADTAKYEPVSTDNPKSPRISPVKAAGGGNGSRRKSSKCGTVLAYGFLILTVGITVFGAVTPTLTESSFLSFFLSGTTATNLTGTSYSSSNSSGSGSGSSSGGGSYRSNLFNYFFPNSTAPSPPPSRSGNDDNKPASVSDSSVQPSMPLQNTTATATGQDPTVDQGRMSNGTEPSGSVEENQHNNNNNNSSSSSSWLESLAKCDLYDGEWVRDESYPLYPPRSCWLVDHQFDCFGNGRPDREFLKFRWKPAACSLPRLNGTHFLEMLRGKRLVFVGDSLNRNMWESLVCILRTHVTEPRNVYEGRPRSVSRTIVFKDYGLTVELYTLPFLVQQWEGKDENGKRKETLRIDVMARQANELKNSDVLVFNTGHWWVHEKTSAGKDYYQEGKHVYPQLNSTIAFRRAMTTWANWVDTNIDPSRTLVFFRGYSNAHFIGGHWNSGGRCETEKLPVDPLDVKQVDYPWHVDVIGSVLREMKKVDVGFLNVTKSTDYRRDAHPSMYRSGKGRNSAMHQDCSHWCLPGVPDVWNEMLYAEILIKNMRNTTTQLHEIGLIN